MKKYIVIKQSKYGNPSSCGSFDNRDEAIAYASLSKKNDLDYDYGVYCLSARIEVK